MASFPIEATRHRRAGSAIYHLYGLLACLGACGAV